MILENGSLHGTMIQPSFKPRLYNIALGRIRVTLSYAFCDEIFGPRFRGLQHVMLPSREEKKKERESSRPLINIKI